MMTMIGPDYNWAPIIALLDKLSGLELAVAVLIFFATTA